MSNCLGCLSFNCLYKVKDELLGEDVFLCSNPKCYIDYIFQKQNSPQEKEKNNQGNELASSQRSSETGIKKFKNTTLSVI